MAVVSTSKTVLLNLNGLEEFKSIQFDREILINTVCIVNKSKELYSRANLKVGEKQTWHMAFKSNGSTGLYSIPIHENQTDYKS